MMTTEQFLDHFEGVKVAGPRKWMVRCPAHDDRNPSLSVTETDNGDRLIHCHAGCETADALAAAGLELRDMFADAVISNGNGRREIVASYSYVNEGGLPLFEVVRFEPKGFAQRLPDGTWGLNGARRVLYRLPRVLGAVKRGEDIMVVQSEKDCDRLHALGIAATCNPGGVGKWRSEYTEALRGAKATIVADRDEPGRKHARQVAEALQDVAASVDVVEPAVGKDISDHLAAGKGIGELVEGVPSPLEISANGAGPSSSWPAPLTDEAYVGLAGDVVKAIEPHSEADPAAILLQFLTHVGNACGRGPRFEVESTDHYLNLFTVIAGPPAAGRKGSSYRQSRRPLELTGVDLGAAASGLSSGEGLIAAVRDPTFKRRKARKGEEPDEDGYVTEVEDEGVLDKRLLVVESEFAAVISRMGRQGNVLSSVLRQAWDGETLSTLTKGSPAKASGAHISVIAHVTAEELRRELSAVDSASGFSNRFLWCCAQRSKLLPHGGGEIDWGSTTRRLTDVLSLATSGQLGAIPLDMEATARWENEYERLTSGASGLVGQVVSRAEAQVRRLATLYAVLDRSAEVRVEHLDAGLEVWRYCRDSAAYLFGHGSGDPVADQILDGLRAAGGRGLSRTEVSNLLGRNQPKTRIRQALTVLLISDMARIDRDGQTERWIAT